ncbi:hypothetical protein Aduo_015243 [Ancylostoma duodenale]
MAVVVDDMLSTTTYVVSSLALLNNCMLLIIYFCCPLKNVNSYRYFFILAAAQDITFSITVILAVPVSSTDLAFLLSTVSWRGNEITSL